MEKTMQNDPLKILFKSNKNKGMKGFQPGHKLSMLRYDDKHRIKKMATLAAKWNHKKLSADDFVHAFWAIFHSECIEQSKKINQSQSKINEITMEINKQKKKLGL